jgi:hypothetical protein
LIELCKKPNSDDLSHSSFLTIDSFDGLQHFSVKNASLNGSELNLTTEDMNSTAYRYHGLFLYPRWKGYDREQLIMGKLDVLRFGSVTDERIINLSFLDKGMVEHYINDHLPTLSHLRGCWTGEKGGGLRIADDHITHYDDAKAYPYKFRMLSPTDDLLILEVKGAGDISFVKPIMTMRADSHDEITNSDRIIVFGYDSYDDVQTNRFKSMDRIYSSDCKEIEGFQP